MTPSTQWSTSCCEDCILEDPGKYSSAGSFFSHACLGMDSFFRVHGQHDFLSSAPPIPTTTSPPGEAGFSADLALGFRRRHCCVPPSNHVNPEISILVVQGCTAIRRAVAASSSSRQGALVGLRCSGESEEEKKDFIKLEKTATSWQGWGGSSVAPASCILHPASCILDRKPSR